MTQIAPVSTTALQPLSEPLDLTKLDKGERLAAAAFVLSKDYPVPEAPTLRQLASWGADDVKAALQRIKKGEPHRFANLFGSIGGTSGALLGGAVSKFTSDRAGWAAVLIGTTVGTYPPAIGGFLIDRIID